MAEISRFFDSTETDQRVYSADDFAAYYRMFYSNGIVALNGDTSALSLSKSGNSTVVVAPGQAIINGYQYINTANLNISVSGNGYIVLRLDTANRRITARAISTAPNESTDVILGTYTTSNGILDVDDIPAVFAKALYTHNFETMQANVNSTIQKVNTELSKLENQVNEKLNAIDSDLLNMVKNVDGSGSGLDADLLDGQHSSYYRNYNNLINAPNILYGTTEPTSSQGKNGDIYILYEE